MENLVKGEIYHVRLMNNCRYINWRKQPKWPQVVMARFMGHGFSVLPEEMLRIGYEVSESRFWGKANVQLAEAIKLEAKVVDPNAPATPLHKIRTPKRRNPQAIRHVDKLENGLFRVNGLFEGKARVCHAHLTPDFVRIVPVNPTLVSKTMRLVDMQRCLDGSRVSIMCMERY